MKCRVCKQNKIGLILWIFGERFCRECEDNLISKRMEGKYLEEEEAIKKLKEVYNEKDSRD